MKHRTNLPELNLKEVNDTMESVKKAVSKFEVETITRIEKEEFKDRIRAMSPEEMELALDVIPVEMCLARVNRELDRLKAFESSVKTAVNG